MDISKIEVLIHVIRGRRVMLDVDLAAIYKVDTKQLTRAVKRHLERFPIDFMFTLSWEEANHLRCQIGTSSWGGRRYLPRVFTEQGVAMLSSVLNSRRAIHVNIEIMRAFVGLRRALAANKDLAERMEKAEKQLRTHGAALGEHAGAIRSIFEEIRKLTAASEGPRRRIGF
jgi:hypothetical protein